MDDRITLPAFANNRFLSPLLPFQYSMEDPRLHPEKDGLGRSVLLDGLYNYRHCPSWDHLLRQSQSRLHAAPQHDVGVVLVLDGNIYG